ncbi:MAG TPA: type II secretion system F family protein [Candidatus Udaeobacter sp.]|nr:type II secretion system F family protein [Candidatus Udaeobacter sp.]
MKRRIVGDPRTLAARQQSALHRPINLAKPDSSLRFEVSGYFSTLMPQFAYRARNSQGGLVEGVLDCADRAIAIRQIESQHCIPVRIEMLGAEPKVVATGAARPEAPTRNLKIPHGQLLIFTEQLAHLLQAGMTLDEALSILEKRLKQPRVQQMTHSLHQALIDGRSFSQALSELPRIFEPLYVNLVAAGEASGALPQILLRLAKHLMQAKELRDRVQQALIYPAFLALAGAVLVTIFITFMVPQLTGFMAQTGGSLPLPTRILLQIHHAITGYWWVGVIAVIGAIIGFRAFVRAEEGRIAWDRFRLLIPGYGGVIRHRYYAQFARTLGTLMENGVPLLRSLDLVTEIAGNRFLELKLGEVRRAVIDGATLSAALQAQKLFPDLFTDMMSVGEQTGHFAETMQAIADVYERELDKSVGIISQLIPPVIIVIIAVLVGLVVFSILSAVFEMTHSLQIRPR